MAAAVLGAVGRVGAGKGEEAIVVIAAGRTALEVHAQGRHHDVRPGAGQLKLDVCIELIEALVASELRTGRAEHSHELSGGITPLLPRHGTWATESAHPRPRRRVAGTGDGSRAGGARPFCGHVPSEAHLPGDGNHGRCGAGQRPRLPAV
jgi:hypothetical protein